MKSSISPFQAALFCAVLFGTVGCHFSSLNTDFKEAKKKLEQNEHAVAIKKFEKIIKRAPESDLAVESARLGAKSAHYSIKDYNKAIFFYSHLVMYSESTIERKDAQKKIAEIYFDNLNDYRKSIEEFNKILTLKNDRDEEIQYKLKIAKANFYLNNFFQAESEIASAIRMADEKDSKFELMLFQASIFYNTKRVADAIKIYEQLMKDYPDRSKTENVQMNIAVSYEDLELFDKAIQALKEYREGFENKEFIDLKIKRLEQRKANLPGSRGLRK